MERIEVTHNLKSGQPKKISAQCFFFFYKNMHNRYKSTERELSQKNPEEMLNYSL